MFSNLFWQSIFVKVKCWPVHFPWQPGLVGCGGLHQIIFRVVLSAVDGDAVSSTDRPTVPSTCSKIWSILSRKMSWDWHWEAEGAAAESSVFQRWTTGRWSCTDQYPDLVSNFGKTLAPENLRVSSSTVGVLCGCSVYCGVVFWGPCSDALGPGTLWGHLPSCGSMRGLTPSL